MLEVAARATGLWHLAMAAPHIPYGNRDALIERMLELFQQDLANADAGYYPRSLVVDFPFFRYLAAAPGALTDGPRILWKRWRSEFQRLPRNEDLSAYPAYYRRNFHWQPDGWLSSHS